MNLNKKSSFIGVMLALGIIYGDIGTSPLYVFNAITEGKVITEELVLGALSCIFWTITLLTTVKYVMITLEADNKGEGGIFSLYALIRRHKKWVVLPAMIGGATLLADGIITPPITVSSSIEGLGLDPKITKNIVFLIIILLFFIQQFGTKMIGKLFGPIMLIWFITLAVIGSKWLIYDFSVLKALNPYYAFKLIFSGAGGIMFLGAVFLCTTGAEALYSDLGHCGKNNIRLSWILVKICLILVYFGQGAWLLKHKGQVIDERIFFSLFGDNHEVQLFAVIISTLAAIIASQALISGSFTLISEAIRLNLWPKLKINYPSDLKGQLYIPKINWLLMIGCLYMVYHFDNSTAMESAYGLSITITMIMTSILLSIYILVKRHKYPFVISYLFIYLTIEMAFLYANLGKFMHGGYVAAIVAGILFIIMFVWHKSKDIKAQYVEFVQLKDYIPHLIKLREDNNIPFYSDHLVYMTSSDNIKEIEHKIMYSIFNKKPKRADFYWFIHVFTLDEPYGSKYKVSTIVPDEIYRIDLYLGFRQEQTIQTMFREILLEMKLKGEIDVKEKYQKALQKKALGDYQFIVMEKFLSVDNLLSFYDKIIMKIYFYLKYISLSEAAHFNLDSAYVTVEKFPLVVVESDAPNLKRIDNGEIVNL